MKSQDKTNKPASERSIKIKVCLVVLTALTLLVAFIALLGTFTAGNVVRYTVEFGDSGSTLPGAPVKVAGVKAGRVESVDFLVERAEPTPGLQPVNVRMVISIQEQFAPVIREDAEFYITTQGVLGEKYLAVVPGSAHAKIVAPGSTLRGTDPARLDLLMARGDTILRRIDAALEGTDDLNVTELVVWGTRAAKDLDDFFVRNRVALDSLTEDLQATLEETRELVTQVRLGIESGEYLKSWLDQLKQSMLHMESELSQAMRMLRQLANDMLHDYSDAKNFLVSKRDAFEKVAHTLPQIAQSFAELSKETQEIVHDVRQGKGLMGQLLKDEVIYDDLKAMLRDIKRNPWKLLWRE